MRASPFCLNAPKPFPRFGAGTNRAFTCLCLNPIPVSVVVFAHILTVLFGVS